MVGVEARTALPDQPRPIIEIALRGQLGFPNSQLETQKIRDEIGSITGALHVRIKNHTVPAGFFETTEDLDDAGRELLERRVIDDLLETMRSRSDLVEAALHPGASREPISGDALAQLAKSYLLSEAVIDRVSRLVDREALQAIVARSGGRCELTGIPAGWPPRMSRPRAVKGGGACPSMLSSPGTRRDR